MKELRHRRQWNSKTFAKERGVGVTELHLKWVHYLAEDGTWQDIDCNLKETPEGFAVDDAPFAFRAPLYADDEAYFEANCRYDLFTKQKIEDAPLGRFMRCTVAQHVKGELYDMNGNGRTDSVIYRNAFPDWNADLIYFVHHGRAPRLQQLVRFNEKPEGAGDIFIPFAVRFTQEVDIQWFDTKDVERKAKSDAMLQKSDEHEFAKDKPITEILKMRLDAYEVRTKPWKSGVLETKNGIWHRPKGTHSMRGIGMKPFMVWDSGEGEDRKRTDIRVRYEKTTSGYSFTKILKREFFETAKLPVWTDDASAFYPDPDTETSTFDGYITGSGSSTNGNTAWSNAGSMTSSNDSGTTGICNASGIVSGSNSQYTRRRSFFLFDTSSLVAESIVVASLRLWGNSTANFAFTDGGFNGFNIYAATTGSNTAVSTSDSLSTGTKFTTDTLASALVSGAYNTFILNASGVMHIDYDGITKFGLGEGHDTGGSRPTPITSAGARDNRLTWNSAESTGTDSDPVLVLTHALPTAPSGLAAVNNDTSINLTWVDNSDDESNFSLERSETGLGSWSVINSPVADDEDYIDNLGTNDLQRFYRIRAYRSLDDTYSDYSEIANAFTSPAAPTDLVAVAGASSIDLTWTDVSTTATSVKIERRAGVGAFIQIAVVDADVGEYEDSAVSDSQAYTYRIRAFRSTDNIHSDYSSNSEQVQLLPIAPYNFAVTAISAADDLKLTWVDGSASESNFRVESSAPDPIDFSEIAQPAANSTEYTDDVGSFDTQVLYKIRAYRSGDDVFSDYTPVQSAYTAPAAPSALTLDRSATKIDITFTNNSSTATEFRIERAIGDSSSYLQIGVTSGTSFSDTSINPDTTYKYRVRAYRSDDEIFSAYSSVETSAGAGAITDLVVTAGCIDATASASKVEIAWQSTNFLDGSYRIDKLDAEGDPEEEDDWTQLVLLSSNVNRYVDEGLDTNTTYYYRVSNIVGGVVETTSNVVAVLTKMARVGDVNNAFLRKTRNFPSST
jgi:hypothetical protein